MILPSIISTSGLLKKLSADEELIQAVTLLRGNCLKLAETIGRTAPDFTDHSIRHMDALWSVADSVLTEQEIEELTTGEAFILVTGFYLHDIGMAYAATDEGLAQIRHSKEYKNVYMSATQSGLGQAEADSAAISLAVRYRHAKAANQLACAPVPGTDIYLLEPMKVRDDWGSTCGSVAESHHWNMLTVDEQFGRQGRIPLPGNRNGDLAYVASVLRIVDYAHINRERAPTIERMFRRSLKPDSLVHWLAQEHIDGPVRDGVDLVYRSGKPIRDVNAWWLYFEMLAGLNSEIRDVRRYLDRRSASKGRFSLHGVRGADSPEDASAFIATDGFAPIDVTVRAGSTERLVNLLAGESLYGKNPVAALRELLQNSSDAV